MRPELKKRRGPSPVWILPVLALVIGGGLFVKAVKNRGIPVVVTFTDAKGIIPGKTNVMFKGTKVGTVKEVEIAPGMRKVLVHIVMDKGCRDGLVEDTSFWIVSPEVSAGRVRGLETLFLGSYIRMLPGKSKKPARAFIGRESAPPVPPTAPGLHLVLHAEGLGSIQEGSRIFYKNIPVGTVQGYMLDDGKGVEIYVYIEAPYAHLVRKGTRFWNASGISMSGGIRDFKLRMESLASLIYGGISFFTPENKLNGPQAQNGDPFILYPDFEEARFGVKMELRLMTSDGIVEGVTKVIYRGLIAGIVKKITFDQYNPEWVTAHILLDPRAEVILKEGTRFWVVKPQISLAGIENVDTLIKGPYITFEPGEGKFKDTFEAQPPPTYQPSYRKGITFSLEARDLGSLGVGSPVLYRKVQVGQITGFSLSKDREKVILDLLIYDRYTDLVTRHSLFWNVSGVEVTAALSGVRIKASSLQSLVNGGITFKSGGPHDRPAPPGTVFTLYPDRIHADYAKGRTLEVALPPGFTLQKGSKIIYNGTKVGEVDKVDLNAGGKNMIARCLIKEDASELFREETRIWVVTTTVDLFGVHNLDALIKGDYLAIEPGPGPLVERLEAAPSEPAVKQGELPLVLEATQPGFITAGVPVYYRQIEIGRVTGLRLAPDSTRVFIDVTIGAAYRHLVRRGSVFWDASGVRLKGGIISGIKVEAESLSAIAKGAVGLATPEGDAMGGPVEEGTHFRLHKEQKDEWLKWSPVLPGPAGKETSGR